VGAPGVMRTGFLLSLALVACLCAGCGDPETTRPSESVPSVVSTSTLMVDHTVAQVSARVVPSVSGAQYSCRLSRSASVFPDSVAAHGALEGSTEPVDVPVTLEHLQPATRYFVRWRVETGSGRIATALDSVRTQPPNCPPQTLLNGTGVVDSVSSTLELTVHWSGQDSDGTIVGLDVFAGPPGSPVVWTRTVSAESLLTVPLPALILIKVRAVDDDGAIDPTPAYALIRGEQ
jgi:hypothetical protein